jgi:hypothetical protein
VDLRAWTGAGIVAERWRDALGRRSSLGARSRLLESAGRIVALVDWYLYGMGKMVDAGVDSALHGDLGVTDQQIGGASYVVLMTHPITWVLAFFCRGRCSAVVRGGLFGERGRNAAVGHGGLSGGNTSTKGRAVDRSVEAKCRIVCGSDQIKVMSAKASDVEDVLNYRKNGADEILEIRASRKKKSGWRRRWCRWTRHITGWTRPVSERVFGHSGTD